MSFEEKLEHGEFCIPECTECEKIVWPPSEICDNCFGNIHLKKGEFEAKIIEFSRERQQYFGLIEIEKTIRIMAQISNIPKIGQAVKISKCGIRDGNYFFMVN